MEFILAFSLAFYLAFFLPYVLAYVLACYEIRRRGRGGEGGEEEGGRQRASWHKIQQPSPDRWGNMFLVSSSVTSHPHGQTDSPRKDHFVQLRIFRCGRSSNDHAVLFDGTFEPPVACKVLQQGRRQMIKLPLVDQRQFRSNKASLTLHMLSLFSFLWACMFMSMYVLCVHLSI